MKMRILALAFVALSLSPLGRASAEDLKLLQPGTLQVATEGTYPPFSMQSPDGGVDGLEIRVMKEISKRIGVEYKPVLIKWDSLLVGLMADQFDVISAAMDITEERQKQVLFSDGWLESGGRIVTLKDSPIKSAADLKGRPVGALIASNWFKVAQEKGSNVKGYKSESDGLQDLVNGNVDAVITDAVAAGYAIKHSNLPLKMTDDYVSHIQKGFAFKKGREPLVTAVNKALADMIADGTYAKITTELIGFDPHPVEPIRSLK
jgi:polar amino acid transport system substrate-binding protein